MSSGDSIDALELLRKAITNNEPILLQNETSSDVASLADASHIVFADGTRVKRDTPTRYRRAMSSDEFHTLDTLLYAWQKRDSPLGEYMQTAMAVGIAFVSIVERQSLADYLSSKIDTHPNVSDTAGAAILPTSRPAISDAEAVRRIVSRERKIRTRNSILIGTKFVLFDHAKTIALERYSRKAKKASEPVRTRKPKGRSPIIIISSAPSALITLSNVKRFLEDGVYEPSTTRSDSGLVTINRKKTGTERTVQYHVIDSPGEKLKPDDWDRVVCVFTNGQSWQFKSYKWTEPTDLFHHVKGYLVQYANEGAVQKARDWNVTPLRIEPHKRHMDRSVVAEFWRSLEGWIAQRAPHLVGIV